MTLLAYSENTRINLEGKDAMEESNASNPSAKRSGEIMPWKVIQAIAGTNGSLSEIAGKIGCTRSALRKFLMNYPEIQDEIDDEREASVERIMRQQYDEAMDGNMQARESYIKMVSGYFSKKDDKKNGEADSIHVNLIMPEQESKKQLALDPETRELVELDEDMNPVRGGGKG